MDTAGLCPVARGGKVMEILTDIEYDRFLEIERAAQAVSDDALPNGSGKWVDSELIKNLKAALKPLDKDALGYLRLIEMQ